MKSWKGPCSKTSIPSTRALQWSHDGEVVEGLDHPGDLGRTDHALQWSHDGEVVEGKQPHQPSDLISMSFNGATTVKSWKGSEW